MKNVKRLIAGLLAAVMMISSVQFPDGTVYAAEAEISENEIVVVETETTSEENRIETAEEWDNQADTVIEQDITVETSEDDGNDVNDADVIADNEETVDRADITVQISDDEEEVIDGEDITEQASDEDIAKTEEPGSEVVIEQVFDKDTIEKEELERIEDLSVDNSINYDAVIEYVRKQLQAKYSPGQTEIIVDLSSYKIPVADGSHAVDMIVNGLFEDYSADVYFLKGVSKYEYNPRQNTIAKMYFTIFTDVNGTTFQNAIKAALATVDDNMSDFQKIVALHDYLVLNCTYEKGVRHNSVYGGLVDRTVVCVGYATTYKYLLNQVGIECYTVLNSDHVWNLVKLDGEYYHVDTTWDDAVPDKPGYVRHKYLLCSDAEFLKHHGYSEWRVKRKSKVYVDLKATSTLYDDASWKKQTTSIIFDDNGNIMGAGAHRITYVLDGGVNNSENPASYTEGTEVQFKEAVKEGYQFDGWYLDSQFTKKITVLSKNSTGDKTIYAKWIKIESPSETETSTETETYTITYVLNGGTNNSENPATYTKGTRVEFKDPVKDGYQFDGWYKDPDFKQRVTALSENCAKNYTVYAKWIKIETTEEEPSEEGSSDIVTETFTITYVLNGGINNNENPATYVKGTRVDFKDATRDGYQFDGWYLNADFTSKVAALSKYSSGNKTIYAKWIKIEVPEETETETTTETQPKTFKVTFNINGHGTAPKAYTDVEAGSRVAAPEAPTANGYRFDGWYKNAACTKVWDFDNDTVTKDTILYAKWVYENNTLDAKDIPDMIYTGSTCKPEVSVYDEDTLLKAGKDYQVKYYNNVNANVGGALKNDTFNAALPYVEITGKGNYTGSVKVNFNILRADVSDATLKVTDRFVSSNKAKKPFSSIKMNKAMKQDVDFTLRLTTSDGKELSSAVIPAGMNGTFTLEIIGKNNYEGAIERTIYVGDKASFPKNEKFAANTINVSGITDKVYTGKAVTQDVTLSYGGHTLVRGTDYTVSYAKNVNKGTATMTFNGINGFSGSFKKTFKITAANITSANYTQNLTTVYSKAGAKPELRLTMSGKTLVSGRDYTLSYANNKAVGNGTIIVKGKGNYTGMFSVPFSIVKADLNDLTVKTVPVAYNAKKAADYAYNPAIKLLDGRSALRAGVDYEIVYQNNTQAEYDAYRDGRMSTPCAIITAKEGSAYKLDGQIVIPLPIYQNKFTKNNVSVKVEQSECVYTGRQVKPSVEVRYMGTLLAEGKDYTVSYGENKVSGKNKGSVTISGAGPNYGGDVVVKFEIYRKQISY